MTFRILSIDGGGIRGIVSARILKYVEEKIGQPIHEYFDLISGTSTGSIVAAGLGVKKSSEELIDLYRTQGLTIFPYTKLFTLQRLPVVAKYGWSAPKFSPDGLIEVLKEQFNDTTLADIEIPLLITTYDTIRRKAIILKSHRQDKWYSKVPLWEACVCSAAAPTFFPAHDLRSPKDNGIVKGKVPKKSPDSRMIFLDCPYLKGDDDLTNMKIQITGGTGVGQKRIIERYLGKAQAAIVMKTDMPGASDGWDIIPDETSTYEITHQYAAVDGGVAANNPEGCAVAEAIRLNIAKNPAMSTADAIGDLTILSIGTGNLLESIPYSEVGQWGLLEWAPHIIDVIMNAPSDVYYFISKQIVSGDGPRRNLRLQPRLKKELSKIDDASLENLDALIQETDRYMQSESIQKHLDDFLSLT